MRLPAILRTHRTLAATLATAACVRIIAAVALDPPLSSDDREYVLLARTVLTDGSLSLDGQPTAYRLPGYPAFIAGVFALTGTSETALRMVQAAVDTLTCFFVFVLARRYIGHDRALTAAGIYALFPLQILYAASVMSETVFTSLLMASLVVATSTKADWRRLFVAGMLCGGAVLFRSVALIMPLIVISLPGTIGLPRDVRVRRFGAYLIGMLLVIMPWITRNTVEFGRPSLTSNTGVNFWIGNHQGANGSFSYPAENPLTEVQDEFARSDLGFRLGLSFIARSPVEAVVTTGKKFAHLFGIDYWVLVSHHYEDRWEGYDRAVRVYREIPALSMAATHLPVVVICLLSLYAFASLRDDEARQWLSMMLLIGAWVAVHLIFFGSARVRFPLHPLLIIAAIQGRQSLYPVPRRVGGLRRIVAILIGLLLIAGWVSEVWILSTADAGSLA